MTSIDLIAIVGGLIVGYVVVWTFMSKKEENQSTDTRYTESTNNTKDQGSGYAGNDQSKSDHNNAFQNNNQSAGNNVRIFSCPTCGQRIRITMPLSGHTGRCSSCRSIFEVYVDDEENFYVIGANKSDHQNANSSINSLDECFAILGLLKDATSEEIKHAYKMKMKEYHPDKVAHLGEKLKSLANIEARKINQAYDMLRDAGRVKSL